MRAGSPPRSLIHEPFAVIGADDYYGKEVLCKLYDWLVLDHEKDAIAMADFKLKNTLSENGGITRGICHVEDGHTYIIDVVETSNILMTEADGVTHDSESYVSMNMWGFPAKEGCVLGYLNILEKGFSEFFEKDVPENPLKAEQIANSYWQSAQRRQMDSKSVRNKR